MVQILKHELSWRLWLFMLIFLQLIFVSSEHKERYCGTVDLRSDRQWAYEQQMLTSKQVFENCTVVEGNFIVALLTGNNTNESMFTMFQQVRVVTGYVVFFVADNIGSISRVLPNLRVIGGDDLISDYAFIIMNNKGIYNIGTTKLTAFLHGGVYAVDNAHLCFSRTIAWSEIVSAEDKHIYLDEGANLSTDLCVYNTTCNVKNNSNCRFDNGAPMCWDKFTCQNQCAYNFENVTVEKDGINRTVKVRSTGCDEEGRRCHEQCLAGCDKYNDPGSCNYCRKVNYDGICMDVCPANTLELTVVTKIRRCVTEEQCQRISMEIYGNSTKDSLRIIDGVCRMGCPSGMVEDEKNAFVCRNCTNPKGCFKKCAEDYLLHDAYAINQLHQEECEILEGSLEIEIREKLGFTVMDKLNQTLARIKEIKGYLSIRFFNSLASLRSFRRLERIRGETLYQNHLALSVFDNKNLVELMDMQNGERNLTIEKGSVMFQNNPQLCYRDIMNFVNYAHLDPAAVEASPYSNGDQAICDHVNLTVWARNITHSTVTIFWNQMDVDDTDHRKLLGYQIYYMEVQDNLTDVSIYEGRSACDDKWDMKFHPNPPEEFDLTNTTMAPKGPLNETLQELRAFTWYAYYVQTKVVKHNGSRQGFSKVGFIRTLPTKPSWPFDFQQKASTDKLLLTWRFPLSPNGVIGHYMVQVETMDDSYFAEHTAVCDEKGNRISTPQQATSFSENTPRLLEGGTGTCSRIPNCCKCEQQPGEKSDYMLQTEKLMDYEKKVKYEAEIENSVQNEVFTPSDESAPLRARRRSRSIGEDRPVIHGHCPLNMTYYGITALCDMKEPFSIFQFNTTARRVMILNVTHYTVYRVLVWACQNITDGVGGFCSNSPANATVRTIHIPENDLVEDIRITTTNESYGDTTYAITWERPKDPNGPVLGYEVRLTPVGNDKGNSLAKCVNDSEFRRKRSIVFHRIPEGTYDVSVQPITIAVVNNSVHENTSKMKTSLIVKEPLVTWQTAIKALVGLLIISALLAAVISTMTNKNVRKKVFGKEALFSVGFIDEDDVDYKPDEWDIERTKIELLQKIGAGRFGEVYYAKPLPDSGYDFTECAAKKSPMTDDALSRKHFIAEGQLMKNFDTTFIIKLYGIAAEKGEPALIFLEFMEKGNLRDLLRERRAHQEQEFLERRRKYKKQRKRAKEEEPEDEGEEEEEKEEISFASAPKRPYSAGYRDSAVKLNQCFLWGAQISDAMAYLEAHQFVHRDLAARNVLVDGKENVKLGDFGLTRDVYYHEYYKPSGARPLPVRWMSPETMRDGTFTSKSDVWSYGIVLYEIFTLGERPYPHVENDLVYNYVENRNVNKKPFGCPKFWYDLMLDCWQFQPNSRPTFSQIVGRLLPYVEDPEFIKMSFACNSALSAPEEEGVEFTEKDLFAEEKQEDFVKLKVKEQQNPGGPSVSEEPLRKEENKAKKNSERDDSRNGGSSNTSGRSKTNGKMKKFNDEKLELRRKTEARLLSDQEQKSGGRNGRLTISDDPKSEYVEGIAPSRNGPVCKSNRRPNGLIKKKESSQELKPLHSGPETRPSEDANLRLIKSTGNLNHLNNQNSYDRIAVEEDSV